MDATIILTIIGTTVAIIGSNIALISWLRSDMKSFENKIESSMREFQKEIGEWKTEIYKEMKDFHGKLCAFDERTNKPPKTDP